MCTRPTRTLYIQHYVDMVNRGLQLGFGSNPVDKKVVLSLSPRAIASLVWYPIPFLSIQRTKGICTNHLAPAGPAMPGNLQAPRPNRGGAWLLEPRTPHASFCCRKCLPPLLRSTVINESSYLNKAFSNATRVKVKKTKLLRLCQMTVG